MRVNSRRRLLLGALAGIALTTALALFGCSAGGQAGSSAASASASGSSAGAQSTLSDGVEVVDAQAVQNLPDTAYLVDTRTKEEYKAGHIPGALNASYPKSTGGPCQSGGNAAEFRSAWKNLSIPKDAEVVLYCRTGVRASAAASALVEDGYSLVKVYKGSWTDWTSDPSRPIEKGAKGNA